MTTTTQVPGVYQVGIDGLAFGVDDSEGRGVKRRSVPFLRNQADTGAEAGAQSLSPAGMWRRSQEDWSHGAGQSHRDRADSNPARFRSSRGIYVWDRWKLSLLPDTEQKRASAATNLYLVAVKGYLYVADGVNVYHTASISGAPTWTDAVIAAGESADTVQALTTDGHFVYAAFNVNGIHRTVAGASTSTHYSDLSCLNVQYVKGRLMATKNNSIYNVTASGAAPAALYTHPVTDWTWGIFAGGPTHIYVAGYVGGTGDRSTIYKIAIQPDGTALTTPTIATDLPDGEVCIGLKYYLGYLVLSTTKGIRLASIAVDGNLTLGSLIPIPGNATGLFTGFDAQDRFVWFTWPAYETNVGGMGRLDLSVFTAPLTPAYATDLMVSGAGAGAGSRSIVTFANKRVFSISELGVYAESANKVASGTIDAGDISFGITDDKVATQLDVAHEPMVGSHQALLSVNGGSFSSLGTHTEGGTEGPFTIPESKGERFEVRHVLSRNVAQTGGPVLTRSTLSTYPTPRRPSEVFEVWLRLYEADVSSNGDTRSRNPRSDLDAIIALEEAGTVIDFQLGETSYRALIEDHNFVSENELDGKWWNGSVQLVVRAI